MSSYWLVNTHFLYSLIDWLKIFLYSLRLYFCSYLFKTISCWNSLLQNNYSLYSEYLPSSGDIRSWSGNHLTSVLRLLLGDYVNYYLFYGDFILNFCILLGKISHFKWMPIAVTNEGILLYYRCSHTGSKYNWRKIKLGNCSLK